MTAWPRGRKGRRGHQRGRVAAIEQVRRALGASRLIWLGTRDSDVDSLLELPQLDAKYSIIGAARTTGADLDGVSLERISGVRVDLDTFDIDEHIATAPVREFRERLRTSLRTPAAVVTYRPSAFLSDLVFASPSCRSLGMFHRHQSAFEHKPWIEGLMAAYDVPRIEWHYMYAGDTDVARRLLDRGAMMIRRSVTTGGVGIARVDSAEALEASWPDNPASLVSVAPFIADTIPVNVGAIVWEDDVTVHPASVQLIGVPALTRRPFGYCGNDFGAVADLGARVLDELDACTRRIGVLLREFGYRGAFGVDFLVHDSRPMFVEVNPRLQGSTRASCRIAENLDASCILLDHVAACLRLEPGPGRSVREWAADLGAFGHFVVHNVADMARRVDAGPIVAAAREAPGFVAADVLADPALLTERDATVARLTLCSRLTDGGFDIREPWASVVGSNTR